MKNVILNIHNLCHKQVLVYKAFILLFLVNTVSASSLTETLLKKIRNHEFAEVENILLEQNIDEDIRCELEFYNKLLLSYGVYRDTINLNFQSKNHKNLEANAIHKLNKGLYLLLYEYGQDGDAFVALNDALKIGLEIKNKPLVCEILKIIFNYYHKLTRPEDHSYNFDNYSKIYKQNIYDNLEKKIYFVLEAHLSLYKSENYELNKEQLNHLENFSKTLKHEYYKSFAQIALGIYNLYNKKDYNKSLKLFQLAQNTLSKNKADGIYIERSYAADVNIGCALHYLRQYKNSISFLNNLKSQYIEKGKPMKLTSIYKHVWIGNSNDSIGDKAKALYHFQKSVDLREELNEAISYSTVTREEVKQQRKQKDKKIMNLKTILSIVLPILILLAFIAVALYYYFKKYKIKTTVLQEEQSETLEKIAELKKIVIKNHIVLKDKTKIYISDLMYIKSEDHYLKIFTNDGKNAFVRGKLSQIKEELPPNFIQSHRSYIINANFIKQINNNHIILLDKTEIPLSRAHKDKFK